MELHHLEGTPQRPHRKVRARSWGWMALALACFAGSGCALTAARVPEVDRFAIESRVATYFRKTTNVRRSATVRLTSLAPAAVPGWQDGRLEVTIGPDVHTIDFVATNDGRYLLLGEIVDLTIDPVQTILAKLSIEGQPTRGNPSAPISIVVFSDFQCPFCAKSSRSIESQLLSAYDGRVKLVFKNLPLHQIHSWADTAAIAGECAYRESNECFWAVHDAIFEQQSQINTRNLRDIAGRAVQKAGGNRQRFTECVRTRATEEAVTADVEEAANLGVKSTPTFFINGRRVTGTQPLDGFTVIVDEELSVPESSK